MQTLMLTNSQTNRVFQALCTERDRLAKLGSKWDAADAVALVNDLIEKVRVLPFTDEFGRTLPEVQVTR